MKTLMTKRDDLVKAVEAAGAAWVATGAAARAATHAARGNYEATNAALRSYDEENLK